VNLNGITKEIIAAAIKVHSRLGPGLLESSYEACLAYEIERAGLKVQRQVGLPPVYEVVLAVGYRMDLLIEEEVVVEIKAREAILPVHEAQLVSHLRLSGKKVGLLINCHVVLLKNGLVRKVNNYKEPSASSQSTFASSPLKRLEIQQP
jgi:GxxExxY protein